MAVVSLPDLLDKVFAGDEQALMDCELYRRAGLFSTEHVNFALAYINEIATPKKIAEIRLLFENQPNFGFDDIKTKTIGRALGFRGYMYHKGLVDGHNNYLEAILHYDIAVKLGIPSAMNDLGGIYQHGQGGVAQNYQKAADLYISAIALDFMPSMCNLASLLEKQLIPECEQYSALSLREKVRNKGISMTTSTKDVVFTLVPSASVPLDLCQSIGNFMYGLFSLNSNSRPLIDNKPVINRGIGDTVVRNPMELDYECDVSRSDYQVGAFN